MLVAITNSVADYLREGISVRHRRRRLKKGATKKREHTNPEKRKVYRHNRQSKHKGQHSGYEAHNAADTVMGNVQTKSKKGNATGHGVQQEPLGQQGAVRACRLGHMDFHVPEGLARVIA